MSVEPTRDPVRLDAIVRGRVQGVGFRMYVVRRASERGVVGWVANGADGSVRCVAEGPRAALDLLLDDLRRGPPGSAVAEVRSTWSAANGSFASFGVRPGSHPGD